MNYETYSFETDELTENQMMNVMNGPARDAIVEKAFQSEGIFRDSSLEREKMLREIENNQENSLDPDELTEDQLMEVLSGPARDAIVEKALETTGIFSESALERERMFREEEIKSKIDMNSSPLFRR